MTRRRTLALALLAVACHWQAVYAQPLTVSVASPGPIVAKLALPAEGEHAVAWSCDDGVKFLASESGRTLHVWATAGEHWLAADVTTSVFAERQILVPGPKFAEDKTDIKLETLRYLVDKRRETHRATFDAPQPPPVDPVKPAPTTPATAATYVYEKDVSAIPTAVLVGLNRLNRERKIVATLFERDTKDGDGDTPDQYRVPLAAAQKAGLPALVVTAGEQVLRVVKAPTTEAQVMEAAP